jgi:hypothetical protein
LLTKLGENGELVIPGNIYVFQLKNRRKADETHAQTMLYDPAHLFHSITRSARTPQKQVR